MTDPAQIARSLSKAQREAILEGRVHDCPYNHMDGTRCPNCAKWPFKKGGAADFVESVCDRLKEIEHG